MNSKSFSNWVNKEETESQQLTYKRIYFSCAQKKNWNRTGTEQWLRPQGFFFPSYRFFLYPQKSFSRPWHISCIILKTAEDHKDFCSPSAAPLSLHSVFLFFLFLFFHWRGKIPSAICWRRKAFVGELDWSLLFAPLGCDCKPAPRAQVTWRISVNASLIWDAKEVGGWGRWRGRRAARCGIRGRVSMRDD